MQVTGEKSQAYARFGVCHIITEFFQKRQIESPETPEIPHLLRKTQKSDELFSQVLRKYYRKYCNC